MRVYKEQTMSQPIFSPAYPRATCCSTRMSGRKILKATIVHPGLNRNGSVGLDDLCGDKSLQDIHI